MIGREAVVLPVQKREVALHHCLAFGAGQGDQHTRPLTVNAEVLRTRRSNQHLGERLRDQTRGRRILFQPVTKALIGQIHKRHRPARFQQRHHLRPLVHGQIGPRGVVAAAMQQNRIARLHPAQIFHQPGEIDAPRGGIEIAILGHRHAQILDDRRMVRPSGVRQPDRRPRCRHADQLQRLTNGPGAAGRRHACRAVGITVTQNHLHHGRVERGLAGQTGVGLGGLRLPQLFLGGFHSAHHRRQAGGVLVDTNAKVDFVCARIVTIHRDQLQDLVLRLRVQGFQHSSAFLDGQIFVHAPFGP